MEPFSPTIFAIVTFLPFLVMVFKIWRPSHSSATQGNQVLETPGALPIIGHLHLLRGQLPACRTLGAIADRQGPIFSIRLGFRKALVVSSKEVVKECFTTNDHVFATRPSSAASIYMGYGNAFLGLSPYGSHWREVRKVASRELLSNHRLGLLANVRASELHTCIKHLYSHCLTSSTGSSTTGSAAKVNMTRWLSCVIMNTMILMISGERFNISVEADHDDVESRSFMEAIEGFMYLSGVFVASDFVPLAKWLDLGGYLKSMKSNAEKLDKIMINWLEEHLQRRRENDLKVECDFIDALISSFGENLDASIYGYKCQTVIKATALSLLVGGVDAMVVTLTWALSLLLNHSQVLKIAQQEIDLHVGRERWVEESDTKNLVYLQAIIKETLRLYPAGPLSVPREAMEDCCLAGCHVPKGTTLFVNIWKLHRDPRIWSEPEKFKPERFLAAHANVDVRGRQFEYIPFSSGRRGCPGVSSAMKMMPLMLARVLQGFNMTTPRNEPLDMTEGLGLSMPKATPLEVILSPRLPHDLYN